LSVLLRIGKNSYTDSTTVLLSPFRLLCVLYSAIHICPANVELCAKQILKTFKHSASNCWQPAIDFCKLVFSVASKKENWDVTQVETWSQ